jgi:hypothetical protein
VPSVWFINTTMVIRLESLVDQEGDPVVAATVEMTECVDYHGETPVGLTLPLALVHQGAGTYEATLDAGVEISEGVILTATIVATAPGGTTREWVERIVPKHGDG